MNTPWTQLTSISGRLTFDFSGQVLEIKGALGMYLL